jgi:hypothetical protein
MKSLESDQFETYIHGSPDVGNSDGYSSTRLVGASWSSVAPTDGL